MKRNLTNWKEKLWEKGRIQRYLSLFLVAVLVTTQCTTSKGVSLVTAQTSCPNHTEHDESCGYVEPTGAVACDHVCDESCTGKILNCVHTEHTGECGYQAEVSGEECNHNCEDGTCSYVAAVEAVACDHEHNDACEYNTETDSCNHTCEDGTCSFAEAAEGCACDHQHEEAVCGYAEGTPEQPCTHEHGTECYEEVTECQHNCLDGECSFKAGTEGAECTHTCAECNPAGELSITEAVFNKETTSEDYKDIEVIFEKGADELARIEREVTSENEETGVEGEAETKRKAIDYVITEDGQTVTLKKETLEQFEDGEHIVYFVMESGVEKTLQLTVTNLVKVEATVTAPAMMNKAVTVAEGDVELNSTNFPDPKFLEYVSSETINTTQDEVLTEEELTAVTEINISGTEDEPHEYTDLTGIKYFINLKKLDCSYGAIKELDVSDNQALTELRCGNNQLTSLILGEHEQLYRLICSNNQLTGTLNVSEYSALIYLYCNGNQLTGLTLGTHNFLTHLACQSNQLTGTLNVSGYSNLEYLYCDNNNLTKLTLGTHENLKDVHCGRNQLTGSFDVNAYEKLESFCCDGNQLTSIILGTHENLFRLACHQNQLIGILDVSGYSSLKYLYCDRNQLTELKLGTHENLIDLHCNSNQLSGSLDVSIYSNLVDLWCDGNQLTELVLGTHTYLTRIRCHNNQLSNVDLSGVLNLDEFKCDTQNIGILQLAYDSTASRWVCNTSHAMKTFTPTTETVVTTFYSDSALSTPLSAELDFQVDANGILSAAKVVPVTRPIYFKTVLADGKNTLSGSFMYTAPSNLSATAQMIDVNDAKALVDESALSTYITVNGQETDPVTVACADFDKIKEGIPGQYELVVTVGDNFCVTTLEVAVEIKDENFPDDAFEAFVKDYDKADSEGNKDNFLTIEELSAVTKIDISGTSNESRHQYKDLKGIGYFASLIELYCVHGEITELDLSGNTELKILHCYWNKLQKINVSKCKNLEVICIQQNKLTNLDVSGLSSLYFLDCDTNLLTSLMLGELPALTTLKCYTNKLKNLDVSNCTELEILYCYKNCLSNLDLSQNTNLNDVRANGQIIGTLPMYRDDLGNWVNSAKNSMDVIRAFMTGEDVTKFYKVTSYDEDGFAVAGEELSVKHFQLNSSGNLVVTPLADYTGTVFFESVLGENKTLSGTFDINMPALIVSDGQIDVNDAKALKDPQDILDLGCFNITQAARSSNTIQCEDFDAIKAGTLGQHNVTIISVDGTSYNTILEVGVRINDTRNFPDTNFQTYVSNNCETGDVKDGFLTLTELNAVTVMSLSGEYEVQFHPYKDLTGIEHFNNLQILECVYGELEKLDLSKNIALTRLDCSYNDFLTELDVSKNLELTFLNFIDCKIQEIDLSSNTKLEKIYCARNGLKKLNITGLTALTNLSCFDNELESLDVSGSTKLIQLSIGQNELSSLDVSNNPILSIFGCDRNNLKSLDVSQNTELTVFHCFGNGLTELYVSRHAKLTELLCYSNQLTNLDLRNCTALTIFDGSNQTIGTMALYHEEKSGNWINEPKNAKYVYSEFNPNVNTTFYSDSTGNTPLGYLGVNGTSGVMFATSEAPASGSVYFKSIVGTKTDGTDCVLEGTLKYIEPALTIANGYIDVKAAEQLDKPKDLITGNCFQVTGNKSGETASIPSKDLDITIKSADFTNIQSGTPGQYPVTIKYGDIFADTILEVGVAINKVNFDDDTFRQYVADNFNTADEGIKCNAEDTTEIGFLTAAELDVVTRINLGGKADEKDADGNVIKDNSHSCTNLQGIEYFQNLRELQAAYGKLTTLDVSKNIALVVLACSNNALTEIDVRNLTKLKDFRCGDNPLINGLELENNTELKNLSCFDNGLSTLELSKNTLLESLYCQNNSLQELNINQCTVLRTLHCYGNSITDLDVSNHPSIKVINCRLNNMETLNVSGCISLESLDCRNNNINSLDVSNCTSLLSLECFYNVLEELDVSDCTLLRSLHCDHNALKSLNVSNNPELRILNIRANKISSLDVSNNKELYYINCYENRLTSLDLSNLSKITTFYGTLQNVGPLPMYYESENSWMNIAKNANDLTNVFSKNTTFGDSNLSATTGVLKSTTGTSNLTGTTFTSELTDANNNKYTLGGKLTYKTPAAAVTNAYIDVNEAGSLDATSLRTYFTVTKNDSTNASVNASDLTVTIDSADLSSVNSKTLGQYPVTVAYDGTNYATTVELGVEINYTKDNGTTFENFPDAAFRAHVANYDMAQEGKDEGFLTAAELNAVIVIDVRDAVTEKHECENLNGIEYFTNLEELRCQNGKLTSLNISKNMELRILDCSDNTNLNSLDVKINTNLTELYCDRINLSSINVNTLENLTVLACGGNNLSELVLNNNTKLKTLYCWGNKLKRLNVNGLKELDYLSARENELLEEIDVGGCTSLTVLGCFNCNLSELDVSECIRLRELYCYSNANMTSLNVSGLKELTNLACRFNERLTELDIDDCISLTSLSCCNCNIQSLDVSNNTLLTYLDCSNNALTSLKVNNNAALTIIYCNGNSLTSLDVSTQNLEDFQGHSQIADTLPMYYSNGVWVNEAKNAADLYSPFNTLASTTFYADSTKGSQLTNLDTDGTTGALTSTVGTDGTAYFESKQTAKNGRSCVLSGTLSYTVPEIYVTTGYLDVNEAVKTGLTEQSLLTNNYFTVINNAEKGTAVTTGVTIAVDNWSKVTAGEIAQYPVTITHNGADYATVLEVGVDIDYDNGTVQNFPDMLFQGFVQTNFDKDTTDKDNGFLTAKELNEVEFMSLGGSADAYHRYTNLEGIKYFKNLKELWCGFGSLTRLDVSNNRALEFLSCPAAGLTSLNVDNCTSLTYLDSSCNYSLGTLDVEDCTALTSLQCYLNNLGTLNVKKNSKLTRLDCFNNSLETLDVSNCTQLTQLKCSNNLNLDVLNLEKNEALNILYCSGNSLDELDLTNNTALTELYCDSNQLKKLDVSMLENLTNLSCAGNQLTALDLSNLENLVVVDASQQVIEVLPMVYSGSQWLNVALLETDKVRNFHPNVTTFYSDSAYSTSLNRFDVNDDGVLTATSAFEMIDPVYFSTDLVDGSRKSWTGSLTGTFSYAPQFLLAASTLFFTSEDIQQQLQALNVETLADLKELEGVMAVGPNLAEVKNAAVLTLTEGSFDALKNGEKGTYTYQLSINLPSGATTSTGKIVIYADDDMLVDNLLIIPADLRLRREQGSKKATAKSVLELIENTEQENPDAVKIYTDATVTLETEGNKDRLLVNVFTKEQQTPSDTTPLAILNSENLKGEFELISEDVTNLKGMNYTGTMQFRIEYVKEEESQ